MYTTKSDFFCSFSFYPFLSFPLPVFFFSPLGAGDQTQGLTGDSNCCTAQLPLPPTTDIFFKWQVLGPCFMQIHRGFRPTKHQFWRKHIEWPVKCTIKNSNDHCSVCYQNVEEAESVLSTLSGYMPGDYELTHRFNNGSHTVEKQLDKGREQV